MLPEDQKRSPISTPIFAQAHASDVIYDNAAVEHQLNADRNDMLAPDISRVLVIYTGGTIGMKNTPQHGYIPYEPKETPAKFGSITNTVRITDYEKETAIVQLPSLITPVSLYGKRIRYSILEYEPLLDSCNMTMSDWVRIAKDIEANYQYFDAFIVLHGTDTMAYTASALSFMLEELGKTVIITGSQVPLTEVRNDAVENLLGALTIAGHFVIPEVCLYFGQKLFRGNRTSKISAVDFDAFDSPNLPSLVDVGINIDVKWPLVLRPTHIAKFQAHKKLSPNVASLRLFPGISETTVRTFLAQPIQGVVLETYGAGNAPARPELLAALKEASDRGVVIVNCTQCRKGLVTDVYATGKQLAKVGVVAGADMTPECALTKLSYLLGKLPSDPEKVRRMMVKNLRGELTVQSLRQRFSASANRSHFLVDVIMNFSARGKLAARTELEDLNLTDLTMSLEDQLIAEKALAPVLLCSAAGSNDIEGLRLLQDNMGDSLNVNCVDYDGRSPLHIACRDGHIEVVEFLLLHGAAVHVRDRSRHTPLFDAIVAKRLVVVQMLRAAGAHLAEGEIDDFGPVWLKAVRDGDIKLIKLAFEAGWDVNWAEPSEGRRAVDVAVCEGRLATLKVLLGQPDLNLRLTDRWGFSIMDKLEWIKRKVEAPEEKDRLNLLSTNVKEIEILLKDRFDKNI
ncbi:hypothetical protein EC973_000516 [Apophysomyces ossiformis]|uniref:asparaginase n=1 Tax=Apophysomyces ossiformis TaxID=679940 RepID=A0A8H7BQD2_9FUNG|nr:hypothetical protein EC973_000516 [Apophysomyces ossiformis]